MATAASATTQPSTSTAAVTDRSDSDRFDIHRSIRLLDGFMSGSGWRSPRSAQKHLVTVWRKELEDVLPSLHAAIPDGLRADFRLEDEYLAWQAEVAWEVWLLYRSYGDALKWHETGPLSGKKDFWGGPLRYQFYRLDTRFTVQPSVPVGVPVSTPEELVEQVKQRMPRPVVTRRKPGRPKRAEKRAP